MLLELRTVPYAECSGIELSNSIGSLSIVFGMAVTFGRDEEDTADALEYFGADSGLEIADCRGVPPV